MSSLTVGGRGRHGFSMIELLVTVVIAGIVFAAMVPFFANAFKRTSGDELRVDATNIAQDRIEQARLLPYTDLTSGNLNSPPSGSFGDGLFGQTYTLYGETNPYHVEYSVAPTPSPSSDQKYIKVSVSRAGSSYVTSADTIIKDPAAGNFSRTSYPSPSAMPNISLTVYFDTWSYVTSPGVIIRRVQTNVTPNATIICTPLSQVPTAGHQELTWTGLVGGRDYTYTVTCHSSKAKAPSYTMTAPSFRLWKTGRFKFDTYPGGD